MQDRLLDHPADQVAMAELLSGVRVTSVGLEDMPEEDLAAHWTALVAAYPEDRRVQPGHRRGVRRVSGTPHR